MGNGSWRSRFNERGLTPVYDTKYEYKNHRGVVCFEKQRFKLVDESGVAVDKTFTVAHRPKPLEQPYRWATGVGPYTALLYRLPRLVKAIRRAEPVWWCEGEKDADAAVAVSGGGARGGGVAAFSHYQGNACANDRQLAWFSGWRGLVNIVMDNDGVGGYIAYRHAEMLIGAGVGLSASQLRFWVPKVRARKADLSDHVAAGYGLDELRRVRIKDVRRVAEANVPVTGEGSGGGRRGSGGNAHE